jgi:hypothetical protein
MNIDEMYQVRSLLPEGLRKIHYTPESDLEGHLSVGDLITKNFDLDEGETFEQVVSDAFQQTTIPNFRMLPASQSDRALEGWFHEQVFKGALATPYSLLKEVIDAVADEFNILSHEIFLPDSHQRILPVVAQYSWLGIPFRPVFLQLSSIRYGRFELNVRFEWLETKGI